MLIMLMPAEMSVSFIYQIARLLLLINYFHAGLSFIAIVAMPIIDVDRMPMMIKELVMMMLMDIIDIY